MRTISRRGVLVVVGAALAVCLIVSCDRRAAPSSAGTPAPPGAPRSPTTDPRIVALSPALAATLRDLGVGRLIVGRHGYDAWTDQSIAVCGDQAGIDYEALLRVEPTHVLLEWGSSGLPPRLTDLAAANGWAVENFAILTLEEVERTADALHRMFVDGPGAAEPPSARLAESWTRRGEFSGAGRVLMLIGVSPPAALGPGSFHHHILERIGGAPAVTDGAPYITMDAEDVARLAPDAIVLFLPREPGAPSRGGAVESGAIPDLLGPLARLDIPAVANGRVGTIDDPLCLIPSTGLVRVADELAGLLEGWSGAVDGTP